MVQPHALMLAIAVCIVAFLVCFITARRALWAGLAAAMGVGYLYGIIRANIESPVAQFVFDAALAGLLLSALMQNLRLAQRFRLRRLMPWVICLMGWPTMLLLVPSQHPLIQIVGWRGNVLFVPFILLGAMLEAADMRALARCVALMNVAVFVVALAETILGVPYFYPNNAVDQIIYNSRDVYFGGVGHFRIPGTFTNSAAYASNMVASLPLLLGALSFERGRSRAHYLILAAIGASGVAVFLSASRSEAIVLIVMVLVFTFSRPVGRFPRLAWLGMIATVAVLVAVTPRLQRFFTLSQSSVISERVQVSVNYSFLELVTEYPLGNGLGGGGTSIPYFLEPLLKNRVTIENEYARIAAEQGIPGLILWLAFIVWLLTRPRPRRFDPWHVGRWLARLFCAISFAAAPLGTGLLNAVPQTALLLMFAGWIAAPEAGAGRRAAALAERQGAVLTPRQV
jgi:hypothetical protein